MRPLPLDSYNCPFFRLPFWPFTWRPVGLPTLYRVTWPSPTLPSFFSPKPLSSSSIYISMLYFERVLALLDSIVDSVFGAHSRTSLRLPPDPIQDFFFDLRSVRINSLMHYGMLTSAKLTSTLLDFRCSTRTFFLQFSFFRSRAPRRSLFYISVVF